jgi:hypothetical protein
MAAVIKQQPRGTNVLALPRRLCARSCNPSPPWANGRTKIVGRWVCIQRSMAGNSSQCSLPPPSAMSCNPSPPWANGRQRLLINDISVAASSQSNKSQGGRDHNLLVSSNSDPKDWASGFQGSRRGQGRRTNPTAARRGVDQRLMGCRQAVAAGSGGGYVVAGSGDMSPGVVL